MSARYAALGMLRDGPAYSYELSARIEQLLGPGYEIGSGQMSRILRELHKAKKIKTVGEPSPEGKRIIYAITEEGLADFEEFFESGANVARLFRRSLLVKIALAGPERLGEILEQIDTYEKDCTKRLNDLGKTLDEVLPDDQPLPRVDLAVIRLGIEADISQLRAELAWTRHAREIVSRLHHNDALWPASQNRSSLSGEASHARRDEARHAIFRRLAQRNRND
jgi:PadR family transcriptional regulator, regulatory protein AphA